MKTETREMLRIGAPKRRIMTRAICDVCFIDHLVPLTIDEYKALYSFNVRENVKIRFLCENCQESGACPRLN